MGRSKIEWCTDTWNPVRGCTKVSPGCKNCYAETFAERWRGVKGHAYEQGFDLRLVHEKLNDPQHWRNPRRVFVNSMSDLFHEDVPDSFIDRVFAIMASRACRKHTFQVLTKRSERMLRYIETATRPDRNLAHALEVSCASWPLPNVWLGVSVEDQQRADERIPDLLATPAAVRFLSCEPLLGPIDLGNTCDDPWEFDWVIVGGESGRGARMCDVEWVGSVVRQCELAGVPVFVKQLGRGYRHPKGGDPDEWPPSLRVREFPEVASCAT